VEFGRFCEAVGLHLEPFQRQIAKAAAGPQLELVVLLPRGQGKTTLLAALAVHHLLTVDDAAVYVAAASRDQARILFEQAAKFVLRLDDPRLVIRHLELRWCQDPDSPKRFSRHLRVLAADALKLHGLTPSLAIIDELHAHFDDSVYLAMRTAAMKRPGSRLVVISTAGQGADSPLGRLRTRALGLPQVERHGGFTDAHGPNLRLLEWSLPDDVDLADMKAVKQVNPASWITLEALQEQRDAVPEMAFRRFHANQWTEREAHWLPPGAWQQCVGQPSFHNGEPIWVGVDVGGDKSASAVVWINQAHQVGVEIYHGDAGVLDCIDLIRELAERYNLREVMYDPWRFGQAAQELERERITVTGFPQNDTRMVPASLRLYEAVVQQRLTLPDNQELRQHMANTIARHNRRGWRLDKPSLEQPNDSIIALCMALEAMENQPEPVELVGWL